MVTITGGRGEVKFRLAFIPAKVNNEMRLVSVQR